MGTSLDAVICELRNLAGQAARGQRIEGVDLARIAAQVAPHVRGPSSERLVRALASPACADELAARRRVFHAARALAESFRGAALRSCEEPREGARAPAVEAGLGGRLAV